MLAKIDQCFLKILTSRFLRGILPNSFYYSYKIPENLIAVDPLTPRSSSKLLVYSDKKIIDTSFIELPSYLNRQDHLIFNNTKVIPAYLRGKRKRKTKNGDIYAKIVIQLDKRINSSDWLVFCKPARKVAPEDNLIFSSKLKATVIKKIGSLVEVRFSEKGECLDRLIDSVGEMPLPPYILKKRDSKIEDKEKYQTIFAKYKGAVAAPTASLHFDNLLLNKLKDSGIKISFVTLHVGSGTFRPLSSPILNNHKMHSEWGRVGKDTATEINQTLQQGGRVIPVGTTSLRLIESAAIEKNKISEFSGETDIFIKPGYEFRVASGLITNFHLPRSTLLVLVSTLVGYDAIKTIYDHAISKQYRFLSYGDGSLLLPESSA